MVILGEVILLELLDILVSIVIINASSDQCRLWESTIAIHLNWHPTFFCARHDTCIHSRTHMYSQLHSWLLVSFYLCSKDNYRRATNCSKDNEFTCSMSTHDTRLGERCWNPTQTEVSRSHYQRPHQRTVYHTVGCLACLWLIDYVCRCIFLFGFAVKLGVNFSHKKMLCFLYLPATDKKDMAFV
jgi:hypothetical protein